VKKRAIILHVSHLSVHPSELLHAAPVRLTGPRLLVRKTESSGLAVFTSGHFE